MMIKIKKYRAALFMAGMIFQLSASEQRFSLEQLHGWAKKIDLANNAKGVTVQVHSPSLFQQASDEIAKKSSELDLLISQLNSQINAADAEINIEDARKKSGKASSDLQELEKLAKDFEQGKEWQARRDNDRDAYLVPALLEKSCAIPSDQHSLVLKAFVQGYLTFEVKK